MLVDTTKPHLSSNNNLIDEAEYDRQRIDAVSRLCP